MFFQRASLIAVVLFALVATSSEAINLRRRLGATYSSKSDDWKQAMLTAVNKQRTNNGLSSLCMNSKLVSAAQRQSDDMAANNYMDHTGSDGSTMAGRVTDAGYDWSYVAENVAAGQVDVDAVMESWMNSAGHKANILGAEITMFGCGYAYNADTEYGHYWTQDFGAGSSESCDDSSSSTTSTTTQTDDEVAGEASDATDAYTPETTTPATTAPAATTAAPATEAPATEAPATEAPVTEAPATEAPAVTSTAPTTEAPTSGGCKARRH